MKEDKIMEKSITKLKMHNSTEYKAGNLGNVLVFEDKADIK